MTPDRATVGELLSARLREPRVHSLETIARAVAAGGLDATVRDLRDVLRQPITGEDGRRLGVLVSTMYHRAGAPLELAKELQAAIEEAHRATTERRDDHHVLLEP